VSRIRAGLFLFAIAIWSLLIGTLGLVTLPFHRDVTYRWGIVWARVVSFLLRVIGGVRYAVAGAEHVQNGPAIYALKHQSMWETMAFLHIAPPWAGVLKKELLRVPVYGWWLRRLGMIPIDRAGGGGALKELLAASKAAIESGRSIMIAPEGTRVPPGRAGRYHPGVAGLYSLLGLTVVPVALNSGLYWTRKGTEVHPGTIRLEFLEPIRPGLKREEFSALLSDRIETASLRLYREGLARDFPQRAAAEHREERG
jgi:1-acyl-sn-glycerol-3-phosphate acyltransferase